LAVDWSRPATNKSNLIKKEKMSSGKKEKKSSVLLRKEIMNKLVVDLLQQEGLGC
jgi:translation initiation factor 2 beta subunit (eIF-2beta)/eIF-5